MQLPKMHLLVLAMMVTSAIVVLVPTAEAQRQTTVTLTVTPPSDPVKPMQGALVFPGTITVVFDNTGQTNVVGIPVTYQITKQPSWAQVLVSPATDVIIPPSGASAAAPSSTVTKSFSVSVTASDQAPAFQPETIEITATAAPPSPGVGGSGKTTVSVAASYFSIIDAQLAETIKIERPQTAIVFPLKLTNFGNANTKVSFAVLDKAENLNVPVPIPIVLQSKQAGGNQISAEVALTVQTPYKNGYMNEVGVVTYKITSAYALDPKLTGDTTQVAVVVTTKGFYVPGPEPILMVGLVAVAAMLFGRRRNQ
ncbi:MAG: hypothetical protein WDA16_08990 [Candidatus Thermoplasmatota archaeon]